MNVNIRHSNAVHHTLFSGHAKNNFISKIFDFIIKKTVPIRNFAANRLVIPALWSSEICPHESTQIVRTHCFATMGPGITLEQK
jgi:hypothetical protein